MTPSRREALAALVGAPALAALGACRREPAFTGRLTGASADVGHRLRSDIPRPSPSAPRERVGVAILGAGPAGLSAAWRLERAGVRDYVVLDLEDEPGGTSRSGRNAVSAFPWGAHYVPAPTRENRALVALFREMGLVSHTDDEGEPVLHEEVYVRDLDERLYYRGRWYEGLYLRAGASPEDLRQLQAFRAEVDRWAALRDGRGRRAFAIPMAQGSDDPVVTALDGHSMADFLARRGLTSPRLRWLVDYACRDDYGLAAEHTSAWAGMFYFASRVRRPGDEPQPLVAWPEGNGRLVAHLRAAVGPRLRLGQLVTDVAPRERGCDVTVLDVRAGRPAVLAADDVVFALPRFLARHVVRPWRDAPPEHLAAFTYSPWAVANVTLRARPRDRGVAMAWDNVLYESRSLGYVCATHQTLRDDGPTVLTWYLPLTGDDPRRERARLLAATWRDWADAVVADLALAHPGVADQVAALDVARWGHAMVRPTPGFVWGLRRRALDPLGVVRFAHSDLSGVALFEEAQHRGVAAAEDVLRARGVPFDPLA